MKEYYNIDNARLDEIVLAIARTRFVSTEVVPIALVREHLLADWNEGGEHQEGLDSAPASEVADWLLSFEKIEEVMA